ncbi:type II toxin-antitoxin system CcdA family antitoxin [Sphingobium boeckii]|nr:type II toxin-antitoxin system CcdA family antitoxin [Sphingobium boeckii]
MNHAHKMERTMTSLARKPTNISLNAGLIEEAKALDINISRACERGLAEQISETKAARWLAENGDAIASSNDFVEQNGLPLARYRQF